MMNTCTKCGAVLPEGSKFCASCGQQVTAAPIPQQSQPAQEPPAQPVYASPQPQAPQPQPQAPQPQAPQPQPQTPTYPPQQPMYQRQSQPQQPSYQPPQPQQPPYQQSNPSFGQPQAPYQQYAYGGAPVTVATKKKSKVPKIIGIVLVVIVLISILSMMGGKPEKKFYGTWTATSDYAQEMKNKMDANSQKMIGDFEFELTLNFEFKDDNTYKMTLDKASYENAMKSFKASFKKSIIAYLKEQYPSFADQSEEEIKAYFEEAVGQSIDSMIEEEFNDSGYEELSKEFSFEGNFKVEDDKLFLSDGLDKNVDENTYAVFKKESDTAITITKYYVDNKDNGNETFIVPFTLVKQ